jgi:protein-L-isoaspartate(D-aspartate) O-methyltransferase
MPRWLALALCAAPLPSGCAPLGDDEEPVSDSDAQGARVDAKEAALREQMVVEQLERRDIVDPRVLATMRRVPRHEFVPRLFAAASYDDRPLPIGHGQTISQPYIVALMTQLVDPAPTARVLDVGTGSGYQAAVLAELAAEVYSIEIVVPLAQEATQRLQTLGYANVHVRQGDGYRGWPEHAPFDAIVVAAAPARIPQPLIDQLAPGGKMAIPVGQAWQELLLIEKDEAGRIYERSVVPVAFVPMTGEAEVR